MSSLPPVSILTAGRGIRMGAQYSNINKALLPLGKKAVISHIIEAFPEEAKFVIALGHLGEQVRSYLEMAHPNHTFIFVEVDRYDGVGSGPGYSLWCCKEFLDQPFYVVASDTIFSADYSSAPPGNWAGVADIDLENAANYCNFKIEDGIISEIRDKQECDRSYRTFTGFLFVNDFKVFWEGMSSEKTISGERQISNGLSELLNRSEVGVLEGNWLDVGSEECYRQAAAQHHDYDFGKTNENIYFVEDRVVKFFADSKTVRDRVAKALLNTDIFPEIERYSSQFYSYRLIDGETLYSYNTPELFEKLLNWLKSDVWSAVDVDLDEMKQLCQSFYFDKTMQRLELFNSKYPNYKGPKIVNGEPVIALEKLLEKLDWSSLAKGKPVFMHGDLQFDNIIYNKEYERFYLLDWRQDFSGEIEYGDLYYDLAKLKGGMLVNYDYIKKNLFSVSEFEDSIIIDFARRYNCEKYEKILNKFIIQNELDIERISIIQALIYLNMAPLHHPPFDKALYSLANLYLSRIYSHENERDNIWLKI